MEFLGVRHMGADREGTGRLILELVDIRFAVTSRPPSEGRPVMIKCTAHRDDLPTLAVFRDNINCFNPSCRFHITRRYEALGYLLGFWNGLDTGQAYRAAMQAKDRAMEFMSDRVEVQPERPLEPIHPAI